MCLTILKDSEILVAEEDIVCWKVVRRQGDRLLSIYKGFDYVVGETYSDRSEGVLSATSFYGSSEVHIGFHSYVEQEVATRSVYSVRVLLKCIIPKGSRYRVGIDGVACNNYCSDTIVIKEEVECA